MITINCFHCGRVVNQLNHFLAGGLGVKVCSFNCVYGYLCTRSLALKDSSADDLVKRVRNGKVVKLILNADEQDRWDAYVALRELL